MKKFYTTYYYGPTEQYVVKPETVANIAAAGFDLMPLHYSTAVNKQALPILKRYGIRAMVGDPRIGRVYNSDDFAAADSVVKAVAEDYAEFDNIEGWDIIDEPNSEKFPILAAIVNAIKKHTPDKEPLINLFPNYASPEQLGNPDYLTHLEEYVNVVRPTILSYDHYHFLGREQRNAILDDGRIDEREKLIRISAESTENRGGFFENIETVMKVCKKYGIPPMLIVLLVEHGPYRNLTEAEILWEVNMCLVYGMKRISYFTYWCPPDDPFWHYRNAICDEQGNKMQHYYDVSKINREIAAVGEHLFGTDPAEVFHIGASEAGTQVFEGFGPIDSIEGNDGVIGFFDNGSIYLCNRDFRNSNTFKLNSKMPLTVFKDGVFEELGSDSVTLEAGAAVLLRA
ncbi:MAG: hypothetical protein IKM04_03345 [Clostridia bacterium]|nr:hypothetical protein [Clostridia bacterium]